MKDWRKTPPNCPSCGKVSFETKAEAKLFIRQRPDMGLKDTYRCYPDGPWHTTKNRIKNNASTRRNQPPPWEKG
jgi:hypothetical protein